MLPPSPIPKIIAILKKIEAPLKANTLSDSEVSEHLRTLNQIHRMLTLIRQIEPQHKGLKSVLLETETLGAIAINRKKDVSAVTSRISIQDGIMAKFYSKNVFKNRSELLSVIDDYSLETPNNNRSEALHKRCVGIGDNTAKYLNGILRYKTERGTRDCIAAQLNEDCMSRDSLIEAVASITENRHVLWEAEAFLSKRLNDCDIYPDDLRFALRNTERCLTMKLDEAVLYASDALRAVFPEFERYCEKLIQTDSIIENNANATLRSITSAEGTVIITPTSDQYTWLESLAYALLCGFIREHTSYKPIVDSETLEAFAQFISRACIRHKSTLGNDVKLKKAACARELKEAVFMTLYACRNAQIETEIYNKASRSYFITAQDVEVFSERANKYWFRSGTPSANSWVCIQSLFTPTKPSLYKRTLCYLLSQKLVDDSLSPKNVKNKDNNMIDSLSSIERALNHVREDTNSNTIWTSCHNILAKKISSSIFKLME